MKFSSDFNGDSIKMRGRFFFFKKKDLPTLLWMVSGYTLPTLILTNFFASGDPFPMRFRISLNACVCKKIPIFL